MALVRDLERIGLPPMMNDVFTVIIEGDSEVETPSQSMQQTPQTPLQTQQNPNRRETPSQNINFMSDSPDLSSDGSSLWEVDDSFLERLFNFAPLNSGGLQNQDSLYNTMSNVN